MPAQFPQARLRRLRKSDALRTIVRETSLRAEHLVYPIFVEEETDDYTPIEGMPGQYRVPESKLGEEARRLSALGLKSIMPFGISHNKDETGSDALKEDGMVARMVRTIKEAAPELVVIPDICFCEYTSHGHCGILKGNTVDNDRTIKNLGIQAVQAAKAGADIIAPSSAQDGQVAAIRSALDEAGFNDIPIMAYSTKLASALYGPFREAAGTELKGDRKTYQMDPMNRREALRESMADEAEGADFLMVKPALAYLDIMADIRRNSLLPLVAYQVSGEYAMIKFAAQQGVIDEYAVVRETLGSMRRAGADLIMTYFAPQLLEEGL
ncbi:porphobilinogen synthase [Larsenimonas rhizosphaerae]|uniref:Delta-aminolevulinic acid dehydratase n=1 Tax=Larsenimonas rhizosphaerae TaxID=2944682 RepID=A0AA41ZG01_9GAMM|nr:porphobilinogen synthase [Larsenimonas rhizosphaerae]MCM2129412.1 porphobilinogen synthase [Larsenimonas rhizosphaerae]MCX2524067.1 porphobilinogen synthase [Larsenimonas rhizosphaerae]